MLKQEEALHFFVRNRLFEGKPLEDIKNEWVEVSKAFDKDPSAVDNIYKVEKLKVLTIATRQSLNYSKKGMQDAIERVVTPFLD